MIVDPLMEPQFRAMGRRLREARLAHDINPRALETELRTTYRHLLAIEEGQTRLFYSESFYRDLFERYAIALGFSSEEAQAMIARMQTPVPPLGSQPASPPISVSASSAVATPAVASTAAPTAEAATEATAENHPPGSTPSLFADTAPLDTGSSQGLSAPAPSGAAASTAALPSVSASVASDASAHQAQRTASAGFMSGTASKIFFVALIGLVLLFWLVSQEEAQSPVLTEPVPAAPTEKSAAADAPPAPGPGPGPGPVPGANGVVAANAPATATTSEPTAPAETRAAAPAQPPATPQSPAETDRPVELELTFRTKGWVWVREANDSVREFVVQEGGTVRFSDMPIFIVLPAPDQIDVKVFGKPVSLKRTEDEKNHGRYTRTMLRQAANLGRAPLSSPN